MSGLLRRYVNPFMRNYTRHRLSHHRILPVPVHAKSYALQHLHDAFAAHLDEGLNLAIYLLHPSQRSGNSASRTGHQGTVADYGHADYLVYIHTHRHVTPAQHLETAAKLASSHLKAHISPVQLTHQRRPLVVFHRMIG